MRTARQSFKGFYNPCGKNKFYAMNMNKKAYTKPATQVFEIESQQVLAASLGDDKRGSLYDEIEFSDEYCTDPE